MSQTDRIEKQIELKATPDRVWRALSNSREFGTWFGVDIRDDFAPGKTVTGKLTYPGYEHLTMELAIEKMDKERLMAFRWHPYAIEPDVDYSGEDKTLVELRLEPIASGTRLVVTESGFDKVPAHRRAKAFEMNASGWAEQLTRIERYLAS